MKTYLMAGLLMLAVFMVPAESKTTIDSESGLYSMLSQKNADRLLLVAFSTFGCR